VKGANFLSAFAVMTITAGGFFALLLGSGVQRTGKITSKLADRCRWRRRRTCPPRSNVGERSADGCR
jgi:hypothetical protein